MKRKYRQPALEKRRMREAHTEPRLRGFGLAFDLLTKTERNWYQDDGDVKRWADNDEPVNEQWVE